MIILKANPELKMTFERLIETMKVPVKWNGLFVVVDNYIILQGEVRSLFFHFDTGKVSTNIIDIPVKEDIRDTTGNVRVQNAVNMILYAFGRWGNIKGLRVDKSYEQLSQLFRGIMREIQVEPEYNERYLRFYRAGVRVTYEDVIQMAVEYQEEDALPEDGKGGGLWHKIVWKKKTAVFQRVETTVHERRKGRLGKNFYLVGYLCPECGKKLHMVVYPEGKEFRIETEEGGVLLARACTCDACRSFYTPRPGKLISEGDVYEMHFGDDTEAYEDYLELLGQTGARVSNYHCNEFVDPAKQRAALDDDEETLEELCASLPELSDVELRKLSARMEEGFYPDASTGRFEKKVSEQSRKREAAAAGQTSADGAESRGRQEKTGGRRAEAMRGGGGEARGTGRARAENLGEKALGSVNAGKAAGRDGGAAERERMGTAAGRAKAGHAGESGGVRTEEFNADTRGGSRAGVRRSKDLAGEKNAGAKGASLQGSDIIISREERDEAEQKYEARISQLERYSGRQLGELKRQPERETKLSPGLRREYSAKVQEKLTKEQADVFGKKVDACEGKSYIVMKRVLEELENTRELPEEVKAPLRERLAAWKRNQAAREVAQLMEKMPSNLDRKQYRQYLDRIKDYEDVDLTPYEEGLKESRARAERQEVANLVKRARKVSREDIKELIDRLREGDFLPELILPYIDKLEEKIRALDAEEIALICPDPLQMSFEEGIEAYQKLQDGDFLPELKEDALKMLTKRLAKIKTDECELLVKKLQTQLSEAGVGENDRHHFYPAKKVLLNQTGSEETEVIDFALASYASGRGLFEYPIFVADSTRNGTGKEGMILTPDHLYYSTILSAYGMEISSIDRITASTGLLNRGLYVHQKGGAKTKIPYAVLTKELPVFAEELNSFVHYLQEKPDSRTLLYLASEKHDTICCFRCGFEYQGGNACPKCGYQNNV